MIYILETNNEVTLAGTIASAGMLDQGYEPYDNDIPDLPEFHHYELQKGVLVPVLNKNYEKAFQKHISKYIQGLLDSTARVYEYDSMLSARAVAGIPIRTKATKAMKAIHKEATELSLYYLALWAYATEVRLKGEYLSTEDFIEGMPKYKNWIEPEPELTKPEGTEELEEGQDNES